MTAALGAHITVTKVQTGNQVCWGHLCTRYHCVLHAESFSYKTQESTALCNNSPYLDVWVGPVKGLDIVSRQCASPSL